MLLQIDFDANKPMRPVRIYGKAMAHHVDISTVAGAPFVINPAGFAASSTDFCLTAVAGRWIAVQHGPGGGISVGTLFTPGTCTVS